MVMRQHLASLAAVTLALAFVALFFEGRHGAKTLDEVAPRVGLRSEDLVAMVPRIAAQTGATPGTSRRVVYLMACSGLSTRETIESNARLAAGIAEQRRLTPREATTSALLLLHAPGGATLLRDC
jgi:hypothetical protein